VMDPHEFPTPAPPPEGNEASAIPKRLIVLTALVATLVFAFVSPGVVSLAHATEPAHLEALINEAAVAAPISLATRRTSALELAYSDRGTGSDVDMQVWRPKLFAGEFRLMYTAYTDHGNHHQASEATVVAKASDSVGAALAVPEKFVCIWTDQNTDGHHDGSFWQAVPPEGYECLSDVAKFMPNAGMSPGTERAPHQIDPQFRCVHKSLTKRTELGLQMWTSKGSEGRFHGQVWRIKESFGVRLTSHPPSHEQRRLKAFTGVLFRDIERVYSVCNPTKNIKADGSFELKQGMEFTQGSEQEQNSEFGQEVVAEASVGVERAISASVGFSFSIQKKYGASTRFTSSETSTEETTRKLNFDIPPKTKVEVWQLVARDSQGLHKAKLKIKSMRFFLHKSPC